jgi:hypothetical protein
VGRSGVRLLVRGEEVPAVDAAEEDVGPVAPGRVLHSPHSVVHAALAREADLPAVDIGGEVLAPARAAAQPHEACFVEHLHGRSSRASMSILTKFFRWCAQAARLSYI